MKTTWKKEGFLLKIWFCHLTPLRWNYTTAKKLKNLHFQKHGLFPNTYKKRAMFLEMQNFSYWGSDIISPNNLLKFCSLFSKKFKHSIVISDHYQSMINTLGVKTLLKGLYILYQKYLTRVLIKFLIINVYQSKNVKWNQNFLFLYTMT